MDIEPNGLVQLGGGAGERAGARELVMAAQRDLFGAPVTSATGAPRIRRVSPSKAAPPADDVPAEEMVQLGLHDAEVDRDELARSVGHLPLSERAVLRDLEGSDTSGNARDQFGEEVEKALRAFYHRTKRTEGYDAAVCALFRVVARDADYHRLMPAWMRRLFEDEHDLLMSAFWSNSVLIEPGTSDDDEDEQAAGQTEGEP